MNRDQELKIQAYLDGELTRMEAHRLEAGLLASEDGRRLLEELRWTAAVLTDNPPELRVPATREFYWSGIQRGILAAEAAADRQQSGVPGWLALRRWLAPASGLAFVCVLAFMVTRFFDFNPPDSVSGSLARVESPSDAMDSFSFESKSEKVFVIWLYERPSQPQPEWNYVKDLVIQ